VINRIVIHCADTPADMDIGAAEIRRWHVEENGWKDIGYSHVIRRNGVIELGRDLDGDGDVLDEVGAHVAGFNTGSLGICLVGGKGGANFTREQWASLESLIGSLLALFPGAQVCGHRDLDKGKTCPNFDVRAWWHA
jgi:hypothetical protein